MDYKGIIEAEPLGPPYSASFGELVALTRACELAEGKSANKYTDSRYAFEIVHDFGALWRLNNFMMAAGTQVVHESQIKRLLTVI